MRKQKVTPRISNIKNEEWIAILKKREMNKSIAKRIRITKTGKIVRRPMGVNHFRTRKTQKLLRKKSKTLSLGHPKKQLLNY